MRQGTGGEQDLKQARAPLLSYAGLLLWWVLASAAGFAVAGLAEAAIGPAQGLVVVVYMTVGGAAAGTLQWVLLRRIVPGVGLWVAASVGGGFAAGAMGVVVGVLAGSGAGVVLGFKAAWEVGSDTGGVAAAISYGAVIGVLQWLVLQRHLPRAYWWVLASAAGWIVGGITAGVTEGVAGWAVIGAIYGGATGCVLVGLLVRRRSLIVVKDDGPEAR